MDIGGKDLSEIRWISGPRGVRTMDGEISAGSPGVLNPGIPA